MESTRFAKAGDAEVAYRVLGDGSVDILLFIGEYIPVDALEEEPRYARVLQRLSSIGRVIVFNRRGVGLSDPPPGPATHDQHVEDALASLDDAKSERAVVIASNVSGVPAIQFAAQHPDRTSALVLINTSARLLEAPDYPGVPEQVLRDTAEQTTATAPSDTDFDFLSVFAPSVATDQRFRTWWVSAGNRGATPRRSRELWGLLMTADARNLLSEIAVPTLVVQRTGLLYLDQGRYLADRIPGARLAEVPGSDLIWWVGDSEPILREIESFIASEMGSTVQARRSLATVLFIDVVASTEAAVAMGDSRWREVLDTYQQLVARSIQRFGGMQIGSAGDGVLTTFGMPADAIRCARAIAENVRALDIDIRAGIHTGEIEILGDDVAGIGVHIAARVQSAASPGEVWVSRTVADLVTGSGIALQARGEHDLKGVPGRWALFAVKS